MKRTRWMVIPILLVSAAMSCSFPFQEPDSPDDAMATLNAAATQTQVAGGPAETDTPTNSDSEGDQNVEATQTALFGENATATAQISKETADASAANVTASAQALQATLQAGADLATAQAATAASNPPTVQPPPPPPPPDPSMTNISFASGATSAQESGSLGFDDVDDYVLYAMQGQDMFVTVSSPDDEAYLGVKGLSDGISLLSVSSRRMRFEGKLPRSQYYRLIVNAPDAPSNYFLDVVIPVRIVFSPGAVSATYQGRVISGSLNHHLVRAFGGQTMQVRLNSPNNNVYLTIYGVDDGVPLIRYISESTEWVGVLPATQDYMIHAVPAGGTTTYELFVKIE